MIRMRAKRRLGNYAFAALIAAAALAIVLSSSQMAYASAGGPLSVTATPATSVAVFGTGNTIVVTPSGGVPPYTVTAYDQGVLQGVPVTVPSGGSDDFQFRSSALGTHQLSFNVMDNAMDSASTSATVDVVLYQTGLGLPSTCTGPTGGIIPQYSIFGTNIQPEQELLTLTGSILAVMFAIVAFLYAIGRAFGFGRLVQTARSELGEIVITAIVVAVFVGTFSLASTATNTNSLFTAPVGNANNNVFVADCSALLGTVQNNLELPYVGLNVDQNIIAAIQSLKISLIFNDWGFSFSPFTGLAIIGNILTTLMGATAAFILLMVGAAVLLGLLYMLMPLFLFVGIVLRSMPWTRAAGGAFLGMFAALYIMFPFLLYAMLSVYPSGSIPVSCPLPLATGSQQQCLSIDQSYSINNILGSIQQNTGLTITSGSFAGIAQFFQSLGYGMITGFITAVVDPVLYMVFAVAIALFVSFDFMEGMGDLLGAPALDSANVLRKVI